MQHLYSFVTQVCHCWCPPFSASHVGFLFICLPGLSRLVSVLFRWPCSWPCSISIHLSPKYVTGGVQLVVSTHFPWPCLCWCPPFSAGDAAFRLIPEAVYCFPLAMQHFLVSLLSPFFSSFLLVTVSALSPFCFLLSPFLSPF